MRYTSCGCNRVPHSIDWGKNGLICYSACNAIVLYETTKFNKNIGTIIATLHQHKDRVNTVKWIKSEYAEPETELLSGSVDGTVIIWSKCDESIKLMHPFRPSSILNVNDVVTIVNSIYISDGMTESLESSSLLICTGTINGELKLWLRKAKEEVQCFQTLTFGTKLPIESCFAYLPNSAVPFLAIALDDSSIQLFCQNGTHEELVFVKSQVLVGHEDWVRCIDFVYDKSGNVLLASGSQDSTIRLWQISMDTEESLNSEELQQKKQVFEVNDLKYNVTLESVLTGHEGWVYGVHWCKSITQQLKLLSCSLDKSVIIWQPNADTGMWMETVRVGDVGGNSVGFYGCKFSPGGFHILANGYQGSLHIWRHCVKSNTWKAIYAPGGHFAEVSDLCWDPQKKFLITVSKDQTTRIHGTIKNISPHEIARPQVHGYDMTCVAMLNSYMFASGAEEKVVRIFTAPEVFRRGLTSIDDVDRTILKQVSCPGLGLTNKTLPCNDTMIEEIKKQNLISNEAEYVPMTDGELMQNTLWPELQKLYGHGYEIFSMAVKYDGLLLATACKSTSIEHSAIILWNTATWAISQKLIAHQLTVTQMAFSPNDKFLVSVSRDRRWALFKYCEGEKYVLHVMSPKKDSFHSRIIWCCAWTDNSCYFATGSRDGKIGVWNTMLDDTKNNQLITSLDTNGRSVTALSITQTTTSFTDHEQHLVAVGYETGSIEIYQLTDTSGVWDWKKAVSYDTSQAHHLTVKRLMFQTNEENDEKVQLASCGSDHIVKIFYINVRELLGNITLNPKFLPYLFDTK